MKKRFTLMVCVLLLTTATAFSADGTLRPMLKEGKTWRYVYHHFEDLENDSKSESMWEVAYTLRGDTMIDGRQYMKMYRWDDKAAREKYYGAYREDGRGRVWQWDYQGDQKDFMICDVTCTGYPGTWAESMQLDELITVNGQLLHRYRWNGMTGVEGVGMAGKGLVHYLFEPEPDCICDYETFTYMQGGGIYFTANDFMAPKYIELTDGERLLVENNNNFAFNLFCNARDQKNCILSPLSVTYALGLLNNGAAGKTRQEICDVLGSGNVDAQNRFCRKMMDELHMTNLDITTKALISNTIFVNQGKGWQLKNEFVHQAYYYMAFPQARDFADGQTLDIINKWGSDHTEGMIKEVIKESEFNPHAACYLLNAIYFRGKWSTPFMVDNTKEEAFEGAGTVPMMHREHAEMMYAENDLYQMVWLPYGNGTCRMQVILPREGKTLDEVVESLTGENWQLRGSQYEVDLKLPRFETTTDISLKKTMSELGMPTAFDEHNADFSDICLDNNGENIYIDLMKQVAKIKLNEEGTEAVAVTVIGGYSDLPPEATFHANRPFLYVISEQSTGIILFMGQFTGKEETAAVREIENGKLKMEDAVYDLQGRRVKSSVFNSQTSAWKKGLYVKDGKKVVVR